MENLVFLKLGGSLITDKTRAHTHRPEVLSRLSEEIAAIRQQQPDLRLVLGHGSGSFGHIAASRYATQDGVSGAEGWAGFAEVWREARALNQLVLEALQAANLPVIAFPPSACAISRGKSILVWHTGPIQAALDAGLLPLVYGDVAFDQELGGTILSTEDVFYYLALILQPQRIFLAGIEEGVWEDYPANQRLIEIITPRSFPHLVSALGGSSAKDVTGGMLHKVKRAVDLVQAVPGLETLIFSGTRPGAVRRALAGEVLGTRIANETI